MGYDPLLGKREYIIGAMTAIGSKFHMNFYYDYFLSSEVLEGVLFDKVTGRSKWFKFDLDKMDNVDEALNDINRYLRDYGFDEDRRNPFQYNDIPCKVKPKYVPYEEMLKNHKPITKLSDNKNITIHKVIFNDPATIVFWSDGTKTVVKTRGNDKFDPEKGLAMAISKKHMGNADGWYKDFKKWLPEEKKSTINITLACPDFERMSRKLKEVESKYQKFIKQINSL